MLNGGVLSTVFIPDTEAVTGSIPVSPTAQKMAERDAGTDGQAASVRRAMVTW